MHMSGYTRTLQKRWSGIERPARAIIEPSRTQLRTIAKALARYSENS